ncbi:MAG: thioredoxin family protein [Desulfoplanes sp.]|jgi:small redox-active disulfide protein 2|nr:thioredoxin family protein [Desulfoplanes sp.]MDD4648844.1 thioredoxin family protein [Desulfoplanes sp.]
MLIKVLGSGCAKCKKTEQIIREVVAESGVEATVVKVEDFQEIVSYGVFTTPAVVVDDVVKISGRVPGKKDVLGWLG